MYRSFFTFMYCKEYKVDNLEIDKNQGNIYYYSLND